MYFLSEIKPEEENLVKEYLGDDFRTNPLFKDIKLVWEHHYRPKGQWVAIAIKFNSKKLDDILKITVKFRPDEFWGTIDGYKVFWWD